VTPGAAGGAGAALLIAPVLAGAFWAFGQIGKEAGAPEGIGARL